MAASAGCFQEAAGVGFSGLLEDGNFLGVKSQ